MWFRIVAVVRDWLEKTVVNPHKPHLLGNSRPWGKGNAFVGKTVCAIQPSWESASTLEIQHIKLWFADLLQQHYNPQFRESLFRSSGGIDIKVRYSGNSGWVDCVRAGWVKGKGMDGDQESLLKGHQDLRRHCYVEPVATKEEREEIRSKFP